MNARSITVLSVIAAAVVAAGGVLVSCTLPDAAPPAGQPVAQPTGSVLAVPASPSAAPAPFPPRGKVFLGVQTNLGPYDFSAVDAFSKATDHQPSVLQFSQGWAEDQFDAGRLTSIADRGMLPIVSWEPWDYTLRGRAASSGDQPAYRLSAIIGGTYDAYIRSWATGIAALPFPVVIRFAHEMNGFWYPWCEQSNGNRPGDYVKAWRHVHDIFRDAGAKNVTWLWSPNVTYPGAAPLKNLYPGNAYVDWIGLSGYYGTAGRESYISFNQIFTGTLAQLKKFTRKPIIVTETGATNATGQQVRWIVQMFAQLAQHPQIIGVIWFESNKEIDWRIAGVPAAAAAFGRGAANPRYDAPWTATGIPRVDAE
jgi:hypothetical protein